MLSRPEAAIALGVPESTLEPFDVLDSFNNNNRLEGFICKQSDYRYGALVIERVNDRETFRQVVYATPKQHYPFDSGDSERAYKFPDKVKAVEVYEKLDGTNILMYHYRDINGICYVTYKTRLTPVLQDRTSFGDFRSMWLELLDSMPGIKLLRDNYLRYNGEWHSLSFELYGYRNRHLVLYREALTARLLFAVRQFNAVIVPPGVMFPYLDIMFDDYKNVILSREYRFSSGESLIDFYNAKRNEAEEKNRKSLDDAGMDVIEGTEGYVFYVQGSDDRWLQFKAKPESIEELHWATDVIPMSRIMPTVWNSLESFESLQGPLTVEYVNELLLEEFSQKQVTASCRRVQKAVCNVLEIMTWREQVREAYLGLGNDVIASGKNAIMRELSKVFDRGRMRSVFTALRDIGYIDT